MYSKYAALRDQKGFTDYAVAKKTGVGRSILSDWKTGKHSPTYANRQILARFFNVPVEYFDKDSNITSFKSADDIELDNYIEMLKGLSPDRRRSIFEQIEFQTQKEVNSQS